MKLAVLSFLAALTLSSCHVILEPMVVRTYAVPVYAQPVYVQHPVVYPVHVHHCPPPRPVHHCCK
jgi:hypothetical protein